MLDEPSDKDAVMLDEPSDKDAELDAAEPDQAVGAQRGDHRPVESLDDVERVRAGRVKSTGGV